VKIYHIKFGSIALIVCYSRSLTSRCSLLFRYIGCYSVYYNIRIGMNTNILAILYRYLMIKLYTYLSHMISIDLLFTYFVHLFDKTDK